MKGCTVMEGDCVAQVFAVGDATACGKVFEAAQVQDGEATPLSEKLDDLAGLITKTSYGLAILIVLGRLIRHALILPEPNYGTLTGYLLGSLAVAGVIFWGLNKKKNDDNEESIELWQVLAFMVLPIVGIILYFVNGTTMSTEEWTQFIQYALDSVMIAVTLIVVAVPEGLPMAVTLSLAFSMKRLMKQNTLPRTMHACETMGAVSVICSDKTGTLTQNQMKVVGTAFPKLENQKLGDDKFSSLLKECIAINTTANLDFADAKAIKAIGNPTEGALLLWLHNHGVNYLDIRESLTVINRLQFTTELKYMATIVNSAVVDKRVVYVKGAPDILMGLCDISEEEKKAYNAKLAEYQSHANRTLAFAYKELNDGDDVFTDGRLNINDLHMMGIVGIEDPVRSDVPAAIADCLNAGIQVKIVTGDAPGTAKEIGRQLGLWKETDTDENILIGTDLAAMSDEELRNRLPKVKIISRARPNDKERAVRTLKELDYIVAVTGDGTNDAPALNAANVGLSMGDGTAVAKEASDMTIIDNSFSTIANAVMWGRSLYKNIKRFILFQMTVNVAACLIVAIGAFIGEESPLTVTQMLWVNLIMDTFAALALASLPPTKAVMDEKPRSVNEHILKGMYSGILGVGGIFTALLLGICIYFQHTDITCLTDIFTGAAQWGANNGLSAYEDGGLLTDAIRKTPHCVLLLDELEKAHQDIYNILLQVMDYAVLTDNKGQKADFRHVVLIMTTNAGAQFARQSIGFTQTRTAGTAMLTNVKKTFKPEFINRLSAVTVFNDMNKDMAERVLNKKLRSLQQKLEAKNISLTLEFDAKEFLLSKGFSPEYGGREIDRVISTCLKPILMKALLHKKLVSGSIATIVVENAELKLKE